MHNIKDLDKKSSQLSVIENYDDNKNINLFEFLSPTVKNKRD